MTIVPTVGERIMSPLYKICKGKKYQEKLWNFVPVKTMQFPNQNHQQTTIKACPLTLRQNKVCYVTWPHLVGILNHHNKTCHSFLHVNICTVRKPNMFTKLILDLLPLSNKWVVTLSLWHLKAFRRECGSQGRPKVLPVDSRKTSASKELMLCNSVVPKLFFSLRTQTTDNHADFFTN